VGETDNKSDATGTKQNCWEKQHLSNQLEIDAENSKGAPDYVSD